jgi:hypothetical protein
LATVVIVAKRHRQHQRRRDRAAGGLVDGRQLLVLQWIEPPDQTDIKTFYDYRKMFDKMEVDAVFITFARPSPAAAMIAMKPIQGVYVKPGPLDREVTA